MLVLYSLAGVADPRARVEVLEDKLLGPFLRGLPTGERTIRPVACPLQVRNRPKLVGLFLNEPGKFVRVHA